MKKLMIAILIVGAFAIYSFLYNAHADPVALLPTSTNGDPTSSPPGSTASVPPGATVTSGQLYKDGSYTGSVADAQWGNLQVKAIIQNGKIVDVQFLQYPNERNRSISINNYADPILANEAIQAQNATVDIVTGATDSSEAFLQSLSDALAQAKA